MMKNINFIQESFPDFFQKKLKEYISQNKKEINKKSEKDDKYIKSIQIDYLLREKNQLVKKNKLQRKSQKKFIIKKLKKKNNMPKEDINLIEERKYFT
jgi:hypothetical protein